VVDLNLLGGGDARVNERLVTAVDMPERLFSLFPRFCFPLLCCMAGSTSVVLAICYFQPALSCAFARAPRFFCGRSGTRTRRGARQRFTSRCKAPPCSDGPLKRSGY